MSYLYDFDLENITVETVTPICEHLIRLFAILELVDAGYSSSNFKTFLFTENLKLVDKNVNFDEISADFIKHINEHWNKEDIFDSVLDYTNNPLVFLNEYLYAKEHELDFSFSENVNIEHIMPASGHNLNAIRADAGIETTSEFDGVVNTLGNKILLEENINKSIGKEWFATKKQTSIIDKSGYKDSRYNIAHALTNYPSDSWKKEDIQEATNKVAKRITDFIFEP